MFGLACWYEEANVLVEKALTSVGGKDCPNADTRFWTACQLTPLRVPAPVNGRAQSLLFVGEH